MKVINVSGEDWDWNDLLVGATVETRSFVDQLDSPACPFVGIAIGPDSEEARIRVSCDGIAHEVTLQSGRVLPLRASNYRLTKLVGPTDGEGSPSNLLQIVLFECAEELAAEVARPNHRYSIGEDSDTGPLQVDDGGVLEPALPAFAGAVFGFPYAGRRQARIDIRDVDLAEPIDYAVIGMRWDEHSDTYQPVVIASATAAVMPVSFYVGGTNEAEAWEWVKIAIASNTAAATGFVAVSAETIGEIGVR